MRNDFAENADQNRSSTVQISILASKLTIAVYTRAGVKRVNSLSVS
jgi:hypothetical protein